MIWLLEGLAVFLVSLVLTGIIIPQILLIAFRKNLFDVLDERKIHKAAVPRLGGVAFMPSIIFSLCFVAAMEMMFNITPSASDPACAPDSSMALTMSFGICSIMLIYLVGMADDLVGVKYRAKFVAQILVGLMIAAGGARVDSLYGMLGIYELPTVISWGLTVFLVVFITNAINLIDGIDGLASGLSAIAMSFYAMAFMVLGLPMLADVAFAGLGALVPFFYYNVFGNPDKQKKIFMGDTGSLTIGLLLSFLSLALCRLPESSTVFGTNVLVAAFAPLAIPCLDVVRVFFHRVVRGHSPFLPDRVHIHHKILALGVPQRLAMISIVVCSGMLIGFNLWLGTLTGPFTVLAVDLALWVILNLDLTRAIRRCQARQGISKGYE